MRPSSARLVLAVSVALVALALPASAGAAVPFQDEGVAAGALNHVIVGNELSCQVQHVGDTTFEFFPPGATPGDCGTFLSAAGTLFTPDFANHDGTATSSLGTRTPFTAVSQTAVTGTGTAADPLTIVTVADAGGTGLRLTETDTYVSGQESYRTDVTVTNNGGGPQSVILYRAGDCYLQNSDTGFGFTGPDGAVGCSANANNQPPGRIEEWVPITPGITYTQSVYSDVWSQIGAHGPLPNQCFHCGDNVDNGAGIAWTLNLAAGASETRSHFTTFSPTGAAGPPPAAPSQPGAGQTVGPSGNPLGLPSNRSCIDRRKFSFRLRRPRGKVVDVQVFVNGVPVQHKKGSNIRTLAIKRLPNRGRFKVRIEATSADGTKLISQRTYRVCKKSKPKGKRVPPRR